MISLITDEIFAEIPFSWENNQSTNYYRGCGWIAAAKKIRNCNKMALVRLDSQDYTLKSGRSETAFCSWIYSLELSRANPAAIAVNRISHGSKLGRRRGHALARTLDRYILSSDHRALSAYAITNDNSVYDLRRRRIHQGFSGNDRAFVRSFLTTRAGREAVKIRR